MQRIGKYEIQKIVGRGGMGTVYEAIDPLINRKIAVKTMIPGLADNPDLRDRFKREAQAAGGLRHRNIVTVYDLGEDQGQPYIAMEFIEGTDLEKIIRNREPLSLEWKLDVIRQICEGLSYAHRNGIVHRDVKPANIRVTPEGDVKIMDFGIAHLQSSTMTRSGLILGTVHYMSPEQLQGQKVDLRADIFSVGAIAYELVAYRKPFDGESLTEVMFKITNAGTDRSVLPPTDYSPGLENIILKALAREVAERYQTLDDMRTDLERLVQEAAPKLLGREDSSPDLQRRALQERRAQAQSLLESGDPAGALERAREALALSPGDAEAQALVRRAEADALGRRVEQEMSEIRTGMQRARAEGHLQRALSLCRRLLELNPDDVALLAAASEIEAAIRDKEIEQLCGLALSYAADGDMELALKISAKADRLDPQNPRYLKLKSYLQEEGARKTAEALTASAREHLALGNLAEARAAAEEALRAYPSHVAAFEIQARTSKVLEMQGKGTAARAAPSPEPPVPPPPTTAPVPPPIRDAGTPAPEAPPAAAPPPVPRTASAPPPIRDAGTPAPEAPPAVAPPALRTASAPPPIRDAGTPVPEAPSAGAPPPSPRAAPARPPLRDVGTPAAEAPPALAPPPAPRPGPAPRPAGAPLPNPSSGAAPPRVTGPVPPRPPSPFAPRSSPAAKPPSVAQAPPPGGAAPEAPPLTPLPEGDPRTPEAAALVESARFLLRDRKPQEALHPLEKAASLEPNHPGIARLLSQTRADARKAEIESLSTAAVNHFVQNNYPKARMAVDKTLALDPENRKANELLKILGALG